jgi:hypothetical protein
MDQEKLERLDRRWGSSIDRLFLKEAELPKELEALEAGTLKYAGFNSEELFGPERCPDCGEALTPRTLKLRNGGRPQVQCRCDAGLSRKEKE